MRIVLDTTILVRATEKSHGSARALLLQIFDSRHALVLSNEILNQVARVLRYPRLQEFYGLSEEQIYNFIGLLREVAEIVVLSPLLVLPSRDVNDIFSLANCNSRRGRNLVHKRRRFLPFSSVRPSAQSWSRRNGRCVPVKALS